MDASGCSGDKQAAAGAAIQNQLPAFHSFWFDFCVRAASQNENRLPSLCPRPGSRMGRSHASGHDSLAVTHHPLGVVLCATLGHGICAKIAVIYGKLIAGKIAERWLIGLNGELFLLFGAIALFESL